VVEVPVATAPADPDAPHVAPSLSYIPALDGIRAFAVLGVMAFHSAIPFLPAGFLGVDTFFVLSGFLITSLLLGEWRERVTIRLATFWARRARRLLPALLLMLVFVAFYAAFVVPAGTYPGLRLDALSTLFYVANWHFILVGSNYFVQTGPVSLLTHTWSLAIEEQFYLVWPLVVLGVLHFTRSLRVLLGVCVIGAVASATEMALLYHSVANLTRLYYGTDTHCQCLLVGASLAVTLAIVSERRRALGTVPPLRSGASPVPGGDPGWVADGTRAKVWMMVIGTVGAAATAVLWWQASYESPFLWHGGFLLAALSTAAVLLCVVCSQHSPLALALSVSPLRFLGRISYGMYLWHFPLFQWLDGARVHLTGYPLFVVRAAVTVAVATASFYLVERPIRQGSFFRQWRAWLVTPAAVIAVVAALIASTTGPAVALPRPSPTTSTTTPAVAGPPVKVLVAGDSTALTLGLGLSVEAKNYGVTTKDEAIVGCGVAVGPAVETKSERYPTAYPCNSVPPPAGTPLLTPKTGAPWAERWTVWYKNWIASYDPNVAILLAGRWEADTRTYDGTWTNISNPTFAAYVKQQLNLAVGILSSKGARVVLFDAPYYTEGDQPNGEPYPQDSPARVDLYNHLLAEVAAAHPGVASVFDLNALVCPGGRYEEFIDGVQVRESDGVHFTLTGGELLAPKIWPTIAKVGREQMAISKGRTASASTTSVPPG
jgi:peptidoglycan/LPS O-acetylase OafA/YrhL